LLENLSIAETENPCVFHLGDMSALIACRGPIPSVEIKTGERRLLELF
jgi:hypothetical protein